MFNNMHRFELGLLVAVVGFVFGGQVCLAQDPVKIAPDNYKVALENDSVRVCNVQVKPGEKIVMHSHPDHVVYTINGGKAKFTHSDGKTKDVELKAGEATWHKAESHAGENVGTTELKLVVFELKKPGATGSKPKAPAVNDQAKVAPESTKIVLDNERIRVLDVRLKGGGKLAQHSHPAYVAYAVSTAKIKTTAADGKSEEKTLNAGQAIWGEPTTHTVENLGTAEIHSVAFELKE